MGNRLTFPPYQPHDDSHWIRMEHVARKYARKVGASWDKTWAMEVSSDGDLIPLLQAAPVNQLEVLVIHGSADADTDRSDAILTAQGIANLTLVLEHNRTLKAFVLTRNRVDLACAMLLCDSLRRLPSLEVVGLWDNEMDSAVADYVLSEMKHLPSLVEVNLAGNMFCNGPEKEERLRKEGATFRLRI